MAIRALRDQYSSLEAAIHFQERLYLYSANTIQNNGFMGATRKIVLDSADSIDHECGSCLAGPVVSLYAKHAVSLGVAGSSFPMELYAPWRFLCKARQVFVGDVHFLVDPAIGSIICEKITFYQHAGDEPESTEMMKSWLKNDRTEIEIQSSLGGE